MDIVKNFEETIINIIDNFLDLFKPQERSIENSLVVKDETKSFKNVKSISFKNAGTNTVTINRFPLSEGDFISYTVTSDTITQDFQISFEGSGTKKLWITVIK